TVEWPQQQDVPAFQQKLTEHPGASKVGLQEAPHAVSAARFVSPAMWAGRAVLRRYAILSKR
ncbi:hypothetical protein, partial [Mesorhizobium sp. M7A.F.Ca.ET.027.03.2.1]